MFLQVFIVFLMLLFPTVTFAKEGVHRGVFVSVIDENPVLTSRPLIEKLIADAKRGGVDTLFVQVYRANKAWFPSKVSDVSKYTQSLANVGEDPLNLLITLAHREGIAVHAWVNLLSLSKNDKAPILKKYGPSILTQNQEPKKNLSDYRVDNQYFLEPSDPRVRATLARMVKELLTHYPNLDGIQFDYIRYPDVHPRYGYSQNNIRRFKHLTHSQTIVDPSVQWNDFKRDQVTGLLTYLIQTSKKIRPHIQVSTTGCMPYIRAYDEAFQDWPKWVNSGLIDFVTVMSYPETMEMFVKHVSGAKEKVEDLNKLNIGVGAYKFLKDPQTFDALWKYCENAGSHSCVVFHYGNFIENPTLQNSLDE